MFSLLPSKLKQVLLICLMQIISLSFCFANSKTRVDNALRLQKNEQIDLPLIGSWEVDPFQSLLKLNNIYYRKEVSGEESGLALKINRIVADYLFYKDSKDELNYSTKIEGLVLVYELGTNKEEPKEFSWFDLNLPIDNVFKELLFTDIEVIVISNKKEIPLHLERLMLKDFIVFPKKESENKFADFELNGHLFDGELSASGLANPFSSPVPLSLKLRLKGLSLDSLNPWLKKSASLDIEKGTVDVLVEFATKKGKLEGYIKFFTEDAELMNEWRENTSLFNSLKKSALNFGLNLMERTEKDVISGKIKFQGKADTVDIDYSSLLQTLIDHFFDGPLKRKYDKSISLKNL